MPATAVTRPPPTDGPRLRNLRLLSESAPWAAAAVASGFADSGRAPPRRRPWAAAGSATQTASITLRKATRRWERRSIAASCSKRAAGERGTGSILHGDETSTRASRAGDPSCYEWERPRVGRGPVRRGGEAGEDQAQGAEEVLPDRGRRPRRRPLPHDDAARRREDQRHGRGRCDERDGAMGRNPVGEAARPQEGGADPGSNVETAR